MYRKTQLDNGIRVVTEEVGSFHTVALGLHVGVGSRFESEAEAGYSHFLEHMLFKGTPTRSASRIAREIESVGGILNAYTAKEYTSYYCKVLYENFETAVDLLTDIFLNSTFDPEELEREREVIKEEVRMVDDTPDDLVVDLFYRDLFPGHPLGRPILGTFDTLDALTRDSLVAYRDRHYRPHNVVISAAGRVDHDRLVETIARVFDGVHGAATHPLDAPPPIDRKASLHHKPTEQVHICLGTQCFAYGDPRRIPLLVLNTELGGGMGSRLFQEVREKRGLAYTVGSHASGYLDAGLFEIFLGTAKKNVADAVNVCLDELEKLVRHPLTEQQLREAKSQLKGALLMSLESSDARMGRLARNELYLGRAQSIMDLIEQVDAVTQDDMDAVARQVFNPERMVLTMLGDGDGIRVPDSFAVRT